MAYKITHLHIYDDIGYTESSPYVPSHGVISDPDNQTHGSAFPFRELHDVDHQINAPTEDLYVSTSDLFHRFTIPHVFKWLMNSSYLEFYLHWNNNVAPQHFYGWVDSVEVKSDTEGKPVTVINYHVDLWRTYIDDIDIRYGHILNRPRSDNDPPQSLSYRYRLPGDVTDLGFKGAGSEAYWAIINSVFEDTEGHTTELRAMIVPISKERDRQFYISHNDTTVKCPSVYDFVQGKYEEKLGITAESTSSVFISPVPPIRVSEGTGTQDDPFKFESPQSGETEDVLWATGRASAKHCTSVTSSVAGDRVTVTLNYDNGTSETVQTTQVQIPFALSPKFSNIGIRFSLRGYTFIPRLNGTEYDNLYYQKIDDIARYTLGRDLVEGDLFKFVQGDVYIVENGSYEMHNSSSTYYFDVSGTLKDATDHVFTYHNGTFGDYDIAITSGTDTWYSDGTPYVALLYDYQMGTAGSGAETYGYMYSRNGRYFEFDQELDAPIKTDDKIEWLFTDMDCNPIGSLPWGLEVRSYTVRTIVSATSCYIEYRFNGKDSRSSGLCYTVPIPAVDITSNSWSSYVYSSQREYDVQQRKIASQQALIGGITSALTGGASSAIMGSITGRKKTTTTEHVPKYAGTDATGTPIYESTPTTRTTITGSRINAPVAFAMTAGIGAATAVTQYGIDRVFNDKLQKAEDMLQAKQLDSITTAGNGWDWFWNGRQCSFISMVADDYSLARFDADIRLNGVAVSEPTESIELTEGPWKITEAVITGKVPIEAKTYIAMRLDTGVRIFEDEYYE